MKSKAKFYITLIICILILFVAYLVHQPDNVAIISTCINGGDLVEQINNDAHSFISEYNYPRMSVLIDAISYAECKAIASYMAASANGVGHMYENDIKNRIRIIADYYENRYRDYMKKELLVCNLKRSWLERIGICREDNQGNISEEALSIISNEKMYGKSRYLVLCRTEFDVPWVDMYQSVGMREFYSGQDTNSVEYMVVNKGYILKDDNDMTAMRIPLKYDMSLIILQPHKNSIVEFTNECISMSAIYDFMLIEGASVKLYMPCVKWGEEDVFPHDDGKEVTVINSCVIRYLKDVDRCKSFEEQEWTVEELEGSRVVSSAFVYYIVDADRRIVLYAGTYE